MGIVNVTPDSFSDGGKYNTPAEAIRRACNLIEEGAEIIDIGGESTRPGATPISWEEEWARISPVIEGLGSRLSLSAFRISVDTYHPETAERAVKAGVKIINCVYAEPISDMVRILSGAAQDTELVLPASSFGTGLSAFADRIYLDPMIGFGTTREEDLALLQGIPELARKGRVLIGASRKRIVKKLTGEKVPGKDLAGNLTIALWAALKGASIVRVHDVRETVQALNVLSALRGPEAAAREFMV